MGRVAKLFERLDALEAEYRELAADEFARWVYSPWYGRWSLFLVEKLPFLHFLKYPPAEERERRDEIMRVEHEIEGLRRKLDQPISGSPVHAVRVASARINAAHEAGDGTEMTIVKALLTELGYDGVARKRS